MKPKNRQYRPKSRNAVIEKHIAKWLKKNGHLTFADLGELMALNYFGETEKYLREKNRLEVE